MKRVQLPSEVRRDQIVQAALKIFAQKGFDATTNKEIAKEAGMASPGLIYHHFKDKASLLRAAIEMHIGGRDREFRPELLADMSLEEGLRMVLRKQLSDIDTPGFVAFIRVLLGEAMRRPECARILSEVLVQRMFATLTGFFQRHIELGNLRPIDPVIATLEFSGLTLNILVMREVLRIPAVVALDRDAIEEQIIDNFLRGVAP